MTNKSADIRVNEKTYLLTTEDVEICPSQRLSNSNNADEYDDIVKVNDNDKLRQLVDNIVHERVVIQRGEKIAKR